MKHTVYLPADVEHLLASLISIHQLEFPGITARPSPIIADALVSYAAARCIRHLKDHGISPRTRTKLDELAKAIDKVQAAGV